MVDFWLTSSRIHPITFRSLVLLLVYLESLPLVLVSVSAYLRTKARAKHRPTRPVPMEQLPIRQVTVTRYKRTLMTPAHSRKIPTSTSRSMLWRIPQPALSSLIVLIRWTMSLRTYRFFRSPVFSLAMLIKSLGRLCPNSRKRFASTAQIVTSLLSWCVHPLLLQSQ